MKQHCHSPTRTGNSPDAKRAAKKPSGSAADSRSEWRWMYVSAGANFPYRARENCYEWVGPIVHSRDSGLKLYCGDTGSNPAACGWVTILIF